MYVNSHTSTSACASQLLNKEHYTLKSVMFLFSFYLCCIVCRMAHVLYEVNMKLAYVVNVVWQREKLCRHQVCEQVF